MFHPGVIVLLLLSFFFTSGAADFPLVAELPASQILLNKVSKLYGHTYIFDLRTRALTSDRIGWCAWHLRATNSDGAVFRGATYAWPLRPELSFDGFPGEILDLYVRPEEFVTGFPIQLPEENDYLELTLPERSYALGVRRAVLLGPGTFFFKGFKTGPVLLQNEQARSNSVIISDLNELTVQVSEIGLLCFSQGDQAVTSSLRLRERLPHNKGRIFSTREKTVILDAGRT